jgi:hypothetical protein
MSPADITELKHAKSLLEHPNFFAKVAGFIGAPVEKALQLLPGKWSSVVNTATSKALEVALRGAIATLKDGKIRSSSNALHKIMLSVTGGAGGAFGLAALPVELPISTTIMLRSIADVARSNGEIIKSPEAMLACLEVFALGGRSADDDATEVGYLAVRAALARSVSDAAQYLATKGIAKETGPAVLRLVGQIASRFGVTVSQKVAAQAVPIVGAVGGGLINVLFVDHYQDIARGHFTVRRLERKYSEQIVHDMYATL